MGSNNNGGDVEAGFSMAAMHGPSPCALSPPPPSTIDDDSEELAGIDDDKLLECVCTKSLHPERRGSHWRRESTS